MDFALFLLVMAGIMFLPDMPDFSKSGIASGNSDTYPDEDSNSENGELVGDHAQMQSDGQMELLAEDQEPVDTANQMEPAVDVPEAHLVGVDPAGGYTFADVDGFEIGEDVLAISMDTAAVDGTLETDVVNSTNGEDSLVFVECELIAVLRGTPDVSAEDVMVKIVTMAA